MQKTLDILKEINDIPLVSTKEEIFISDLCEKLEIISDIFLKDKKSWAQIMKNASACNASCSTPTEWQKSILKGIME